MAVVTDKFVFCHLPKCGGQFIRHALNVLNIKNSDIGLYHCPYKQIAEDISDKLVSVINVRHPYSWYKSRWYHRIRLGWLPEHPIDWDCASNDFNKFVTNVGEVDPNGRLTSLVKLFDDGPNGKADYVIRQEFLKDDFFKLLVDFYDFDHLKYWNLDYINSSGVEYSSDDMAVYDDNVLKEMLRRERYVVDKYYDSSAIPSIRDLSLIL